MSSSVEPVTGDVSGLLLITDTLQTPGSGVLGYLLTRAIRQGECVCLVSIGPSRPYYLGLTRRLGLNLANLELAGHVRFIDYLPLLESAKREPSKASNGWLLPTVPMEQCKHPKQWILFEDLTALLYWGVSVKEVMRLVVHSLSLVSESHGCVAGTIHNDDVGDVEAQTLIKLLSPMSQTKYQIRMLSSGATQGIDGQLDVMSGPRSRERPTIRELFYKLNDSGPTFFPRGLSHGVI
ncbi:hypothetical protein SmJEL517_g01570 [Synchytrium microbalum]|uniref:Elongator complex protein 6 n=1 Tax=Synchytrium microbalum TaxID=1806994 RepID=A0A507CFI4_9FUNG|nr:uncharacterized protein SmJEL517_g01570 [Synchytrium microbalum]TPX36345.1 hypothetical protein SmJEL517_g01570 [Synchytrium microbalum]